MQTSVFHEVDKLPEHSLGSENTQNGQWLMWACRLQQQIICDWIILKIPILLQVDNVFNAHDLALIWRGGKSSTLEMAVTKTIKSNLFPCEQKQQVNASDGSAVTDDINVYE